MHNSLWRKRRRRDDGRVPSNYINPLPSGNWSLKRARARLANHLSIEPRYNLAYPRSNLANFTLTSVTPRFSGRSRGKAAGKTERRKLVIGSNGKVPNRYRENCFGCRCLYSFGETSFSNRPLYENSYFFMQCVER